jgi:hypothetical protein
MEPTEFRLAWLHALALTAAAMALSTVARDAIAQAPAPASVQAQDWDVFVDPPTRFAFVKTPRGWRFVRQLDEEQMTRLPPTTLTSLLPPDDTDVRLAQPVIPLPASPGPGRP